MFDVSTTTTMQGEQQNTFTEVCSSPDAYWKFFFLELLTRIPQTSAQILPLQLTTGIYADMLDPPRSDNQTQDTALFQTATAATCINTTASTPSAPSSYGLYSTVPPFCHQLGDKSKRRERRSRANFSNFQLMELEGMFHVSHYPGLRSREDMARRLGLSESRIQVWFQNQRAKWRKRENTRKGPGRPAHNSYPLTCSGDPISPSELEKRQSLLQQKRQARGDNRQKQQMPSSYASSTNRWEYEQNSVLTHKCIPPPPPPLSLDSRTSFSSNSPLDAVFSPSTCPSFFIDRLLSNTEQRPIEQ